MSLASCARTKHFPLPPDCDVKLSVGLGRESDVETPNVITSLVVNKSCPYDYMSYANTSHPRRVGSWNLSTRCSSYN